MREREQSEGQRLLQIKDTIHTYWMQLPPEHQATMALVLIKHTLAGQWGDWLREAISLLDQPPLATDTEPTSPLKIQVTLTREDIDQLPLTDAEKAQLTDEDIHRIGSNVELNVHEMIWDEIEAVTLAEIDAKKRKQ